MAVLNKCVQIQQTLQQSLRSGALGLCTVNRKIKFHYTPDFPAFTALLNQSEDSCSNLFWNSVRCKTTNLSLHKGTIGRRRAKLRGIKREDGEWVSAGTLLVRQLGVLYFPGLNVGLGRNRDLFAMEHGIVMITTEKVKPDWSQPIMQTFFGQYASKDVPLYRIYFHVLTDPMPQKFNLVNQV